MCGIIGVIHDQEAAEDLFLGLQNLQHRGQDGGGIVTADSNGLHTQKGSGLLDIAFPIEDFHLLKGTLGIGHTRYTTTGGKDPRLLQPFVAEALGLAIAHNGNIVNFHDLRREIWSKEPTSLQSGNDSELILWQLAHGLANCVPTFERLEAAVKTLSQRLIGSYSVVGLMNGFGLFAFRDPNGLRPLVMGSRIDESGKVVTAFASETTALEFLNYQHLETLQPGELVFVDMDGAVHRSVYAPQTPSHCMFEWVYFSRVESVLDNLSVYHARFNLGIQLGQAVKQRGLQPDIVVSIPETSRIAATALAETLNIPLREVLIKNRYVNRTFILDSQAQRLAAIQRKLYPVAEAMRGKKVLLVDDSIVRGNTAIKIIEMVRQAGATEIYIASTCPPIKFPCYYGIDFPDQNELLAGEHNLDELPEILGVEALVYQTLEGLHDAIEGKPLCTACLTGEYPTDVTSAVRKNEKRLKDRDVVRS